MDIATVGIAALGLILGPLAFFAYSWVFDRLYPTVDLGLRSHRAQAQMLFATVTSFGALAAVLFLALWAFDLYPLYSRGPLFFYSFFIGAGVFGFDLRLVQHFRSLLHARDRDSEPPHRRRTLRGGSCGTLGDYAP